MAMWVLRGLSPISFIQVKTPIQAMTLKILRICIFSSANYLWKHSHTSLGIPCLPWFLSSIYLPCPFPRCASLIVEMFLNAIMTITKINLLVIVSGQETSMCQVLGKGGVTGGKGNVFSIARVECGSRTTCWKGQGK